MKQDKKLPSLRFECDSCHKDLPLLKLGWMVQGGQYCEDCVKSFKEVDKIHD